MKRNLAIALLLCACSTGINAEDAATVKPLTMPNDTVHDIEEIVVVGTPKENARLRQQTLSSNSFSGTQLRLHGVSSLKSLSAMAPNLFIPSYGSKLTTSAYIRGIGSRINTPAIGLYVDNIPYINKSSFDFNYSDVERIDVMRGPQGTLYGRNTMGGLIRVFTKSPFAYQGTDLHLEAATHGEYKARVTHYHRLSDRFAFSGGFFYEHADGFFRNAAKGNSRADRSNDYGARLRAVWLPTSNTKLDLTANYEYLTQGAYPYQYLGVAGGEETRADKIGLVSYNRDGHYRRHLFNAGLNIEHQAQGFTFNSVTGYQLLKDKMDMDQDYTEMDIFTLQQRQLSHTLTQDFAFKSRPDRRWEWTTGLSGFYQWLDTKAPVTFHEDGIRSLIEDNVNSVFRRLQASNPRMPSMNLDVLGSSFAIRGAFSTPTANAALYHQSTVHDLLVPGLSLTLGARVEYERVWIDYNSGTALTFDFNIPSMERVPSMQPMLQQLKGIGAGSDLMGSLSHDNWELLPKVALKFDLDSRNNLYASLSKGYRSGGYNIQMFSDLVESSLSSSMMGAVDQKSGGMMTQMAGDAMSGFAGFEPDVDGTVAYRPERSWNYELGGHFTFADGALQTDMAVFLMNTTDQQISRFSANGFGRITVNAGKSRSYGAELSLRWKPTSALSLNANYGYTHATFRDYRVSQTTDYTGNWVPFVPRHTLNLNGSYTIGMRRTSWLDAINLNAGYTGAGRIYWTEDNAASQPFYGLVDGSVELVRGDSVLGVWVRNAFDKSYAAFYFESLGRKFRQRGNPLQVGMTLDLKF